MSAPTNNSRAITTTATRSGSRVRIARADDVIAGAPPLISVMSDDAEALTLTPTAARAVAAMLTRAATDTIEVLIRITNTYPTLGLSFGHDFYVDVAPPRDHQELDGWALDELIPHTGEGGSYVNQYGVYEVEITAAAAPFAHLIGLRTTVEG